MCLDSFRMRALYTTQRVSVSLSDTAEICLDVFSSARLADMHRTPICVSPAPTRAFSLRGVTEEPFSLVWVVRPSVSAFWLE